MTIALHNPTTCWKWKHLDTLHNSQTLKNDTWYLIYLVVVNEFPRGLILIIVKVYSIGTIITNAT